MTGSQLRLHAMALSKSVLYAVVPTPPSCLHPGLPRSAACYLQPVPRPHTTLKLLTLNSYARDSVKMYDMGATRFRRKLSRLEGMPGATCPQSGGKLELPTHSWLWLPSLN